MVRGVEEKIEGVLEEEIYVRLLENQRNKQSKLEQQKYIKI